MIGAPIEFVMMVLDFNDEAASPSQCTSHSRYLLLNQRTIEVHQDKYL